jgi:hypothetical protein
VEGDCGVGVGLKVSRLVIPAQAGIALCFSPCGQFTFILTTSDSRLRGNDEAL